MSIKHIRWGDLEKEVEGWWIKELSDGSRMYYVDHKEGNGFSFKQVNLVSYIYTEEWDDKEAESELLFHGLAYYDGIRHLYFGDERGDNYGYFYYPVIKNMQEALEFLGELEKKYCNSIE